MAIHGDDDEAGSIDAETRDAEMLFESYLDLDTGAWSIRRISTRPPSGDANDGDRIPVVTD